MRVATDDGAETQCSTVSIECVIGSSGWIPVEGMSPEETFTGEQITLKIDEVRGSLVEDNMVTITIKKHTGMDISRKLSLTKLFNLARDNYDDQGQPIHEDLIDEED